MEKNKITREQFDKELWNMTTENRDALWLAFQAWSDKMFDGDDYSCECSMCGKPMKPSKTGRCSTCETVWNG